jgi:hypothetical protein
MNIIEITESNYRDYLSLDIMAFSFAYEGAMGEMGAIYIIDRDGKIYHADYCQGNDPIDPSHIKDIIPVFKDISWRMFDCLSSNPNWKTVDLFAGNNLLMVDEIYDDFMKKVQDANFEIPSRIFQYWPGFVLGLLGKEFDNLTMKEIWKQRKSQRESLST